MRKTIVTYNAVIDYDLFNVVESYLKLNRQKFFETDDMIGIYSILANSSFDEYVKLATDAITWLEEVQLAKVTHLTYDDDAPNDWTTLYYQVLSYMNEECLGEPSYRSRVAEDQLELCVRCINALRQRVSEMREPCDEDLDRID